MVIFQNQLLTANSRQGKGSGQHKLHKKANVNPYYLTLKLKCLAREYSLEVISPFCNQLQTGSKQSHCDCSIFPDPGISLCRGKTPVTLRLHFCSYNSNCRRVFKLILVSCLVCFAEEQGYLCLAFVLSRASSVFGELTAAVGSAELKGKASPVESGARSPLWSCQRSLARLHLFRLLRRNQSLLSGWLLCQVLL